MKKIFLTLIVFLFSLNVQSELNTSNYIIKPENIEINKPYNSISKSGAINIIPCKNCTPIKYKLTDSTILYYFGKTSKLENLSMYTLKNEDIKIHISVHKKRKSVIYLEWGPLEIGGVE